MSSQPAVLPVPGSGAPSAAPALRLFVVGRITSTRSFDGGRSTVIVTPASDSYSHPSTVEVRSKGQLGQKGEEVRVLCQLRGYLRRFEFTDKKTGEVKRGERAELSLDAVE